MEEKKLDKDINVRSKTELSDEEIIKDIERSTGMPSYWKKIVLDLIHRLQSENEALQKGVKRLKRNYEKAIHQNADECVKKFCESTVYADLERLTKENSKQKAEIERLKRYEMTESEFQKYCAYKIIEPQIRGCLDRERELQKQVNELKMENARAMRGCEWLSDCQSQAIKDTAKEIIGDMFKEIEGYENIDIILKRIAERYGVEVE